MWTELKMASLRHHTHSELGEICADIIPVSGYSSTLHWLRLTTWFKWQIYVIYVIPVSGYS
jgi:hypothetical protein